jgi:hypothetical protein
MELKLLNRSCLFASVDLSIDWKISEEFLEGTFSTIFCKEELRILGSISYIFAKKLVFS